MNDVSTNQPSGSRSNLNAVALQMNFSLTVVKKQDFLRGVVRVGPDHAAFIDVLGCYRKIV
jgi:hypothetical protein